MQLLELVPTRIVNLASHRDWQIDWPIYDGEWVHSEKLMAKRLTYSQRIQALQHSPADHMPGRRGDPMPIARNLDPKMHPFARHRERARALNAAKLERIFAKPFVGNLDGHADAIECLARKPHSLSLLASGSWDGGMSLEFIFFKIFFSLTTASRNRHYCS